MDCQNCAGRDEGSVVAGAHGADGQLSALPEAQKHRTAQKENFWGSSGSWPRLSSALHCESSPKQGVAEERRRLPSLPEESED